MQFFNNHIDTIVSLVLGGIITWVFSWAFYRLQKRDANSALTERYKHCRDELLDIIESYIINKQNISEETIINLIQSSEREYQVQLNQIKPIFLLQDVMLRLLRSKHLDSIQKHEYSSLISNIIDSINYDHTNVVTATPPRLMNLSNFRLIVTSTAFMMVTILMISFTFENYIFHHLGYHDVMLNLLGMVLGVVATFLRFIYKNRKEKKQFNFDETHSDNLSATL